MTRFRSARNRLGGALVVLALAATACSNSGDDSADDSATTQATSETTDAVSTTAAPTTTAGSTETTVSGATSTAPDTTEAQPDTSTFVPLNGTPGVTDSEIRFAAFGTNSNNPLGTCVLDCFIDGINAYFAFRNNEGGIYGRQLVLSKELDDELSNNQVRALEIVSANDTFGAFSATQIASGWHDIANAGMPLYVWAIHFNEMNGQDSIFGPSGVVCGTCTSHREAYAGTLVNATKVAFLGYGVSQNSKDCANATKQSVEMYSAETGQQAAYINDNLAFGLPNGIAPEVTAMKDAGVDFITACIDLNGMKTLAQELERQGMGDVPMLHANTYDQQFVAEAGDLFEGDLVFVTFRPFEADPGDSGLADFFEWMETTGSEITEISMMGWINADLAYQGLVAAGPEFSRENVIAATNQFTDYSADGLVDPIDWTRQHEPPTQDDPTTHGNVLECASYVRITGGAFEFVGDPTKPFSCWSNANRDWAEPTPTDFG